MVEKGTIPASNQGLPTSLTRETGLLHFEHLIFTSSIQGRCGVCPANLSKPETAFSSNSFLDPITSKLPHSHSKIGKAKPQYRFFEINQSSIFFNQSNSRAKPKLGCHLICLVITVIGSRSLSIEIYHSSTTRQTNSFLHRQQTGYRC